VWEHTSHDCEDANLWSREVQELRIQKEELEGRRQHPLHRHRHQPAAPPPRRLHHHHHHHHHHHPQHPHMRRRQLNPPPTPHPHRRHPRRHHTPRPTPRPRLHHHHHLLLLHFLLRYHYHHNPSPQPITTHASTRETHLGGGNDPNAPTTIEDGYRKWKPRPTTTPNITPTARAIHRIVGGNTNSSHARRIHPLLTRTDEEVDSRRQ